MKKNIKQNIRTNLYLFKVLFIIYLFIAKNKKVKHTKDTKKLFIFIPKINIYEIFSFDFTKNLRKSLYLKKLFQIRRKRKVVYDKEIYIKKK